MEAPWTLLDCLIYSPDSHILGNSIIRVVDTGILLHLRSFRSLTALGLSCITRHCKLLKKTTIDLSCKFGGSEMMCNRVSRERKDL